MAHIYQSMSHSLISEYIDLLMERAKYNLSESTKALEEGKIDQAIKQHENDPKLVEFLQHIKSVEILPKYIPMAIKAFRETPGISSDYIAMLVKSITNEFETYLTNNLIPANKKDIGKFSSWREFKEFVNTDMRSLVNSKEREKRQFLSVKKETERFFEDETYLIIEPKSEQSSCVYGKGTRWCISGTEGSNHFEEYSSSGARFLFIINKKNNDKDAISFGAGVSTVEIFDAQDKEKKPEYINNKYPPYIVEKLNEILLQIIGDEPFVSINVNELMANPLSFLKWPNPNKIKTLFSNQSNLLLGQFLSKLIAAQPSGTPEEVAGYNKMKRDFVSYFLSRYITQLPLTSMSGGKLWLLLEADPNLSMWDLPWQIERKALYLAMLDATQAQDAPKFRLAALIAAYSPKDAGDVVKSLDFPAIHKALETSKDGENSELVVNLSQASNKIKMILKQKTNLDSATLLDSLLPSYALAPVISGKTRSYWVEMAELLSITQNLLNYWQISDYQTLLNFLGAANET